MNLLPEIFFFRYNIFFMNIYLNWIYFNNTLASITFVYHKNQTYVLHNYKMKSNY